MTISGGAREEICKKTPLTFGVFEDKAFGVTPLKFCIILYQTHLMNVSLVAPRGDILHTTAILGTVHKLCCLKIGYIWPPIPHFVVFLLCKIGQFLAPPPLPRRHSLWTATSVMCDNNLSRDKFLSKRKPLSILLTWMKEPKNWSCQHFAWAIFSQMRMLNFDINLPLTTDAPVLYTVGL